LLPLNGTYVFNCTGVVEDCNGHGTHVAGIVGSPPPDPGVRLHRIRCDQQRHRRVS
jgi:hypothetical protein